MVLLWQVALGAGLARSLGDELVDVVLLWQVALGAGLADELVDVVVQGQVALGYGGAGRLLLSYSLTLLLSYSLTLLLLYSCSFLVILLSVPCGPARRRRARRPQLQQQHSLIAEKNGSEGTR